MIFARLPMLLLLIRPTRPVAVLQFAGVSFVVLGVLRLARLPAARFNPASSGRCIARWAGHCSGRHWASP